MKHCPSSHPDKSLASRDKSTEKACSCSTAVSIGPQCKHVHLDLQMPHAPTREAHQLTCPVRSALPRGKLSAKHHLRNQQSGNANSLVLLAFHVARMKNTFLT